MEWQYVMTLQRNTSMEFNKMNKFFMSIFNILLLLPVIFCFSKNTYANTDIQDFFKPAAIRSMMLRPDGNAILVLKNQGDKQLISFKQLPKGTEDIIFSSADYAADSMIANLIWLDNRYAAVQFIESKAGIADLIDTKTIRKMLILDTYAKKGTPEQILIVRTPGWLSGVLPHEEGKFLYAKSGIQSKIYKLNISLLKPEKFPLTKSDKIDGGQFIADNQILEVKGYATRWFSKQYEKPKAVLHFAEPYVLSLTEFDSKGDQHLLTSWKLNEVESKDKSDQDEETFTHYLPIALATTENEYYCIDRTEEEPRSLYLVNFKTKTFRLIYETSAFKIIEPVFSSDNQLVGVQVLRNERLAFEYVTMDKNKKIGNQQQHLSIAFSTSQDKKKQLIYEETYNQPGQYWLESSSGKILLGEKYPWFSNRLTSRQIEGEVAVAGLKIPYLLNLPTSNAKAPLIVMPHGGPIGVYDTPYFDPVTQLLNAQGFAVLRVNFRGSSGRSEALKEAGKRQWGDLMLTDIHSATESVINHPEIDKSRICLMGLSYGAYASSMLLIQHPETYQCAVVVAGVYDLNLYLQSAQFSEKQKEWSKEYVGDYVNDYDKLKSISPIYLTDKLQKPILVMHGKKDDIVDIEQSYRLKTSLEKSSKIFSFKILDDLKHDIKDQEQASNLFSSSLDFLNQHLK